MKRVLSLVLALVLVLGMIPTFAADATGAQNLYDNGFITGKDGATVDAKLDVNAKLTRAQLAALIAELNGAKEEAAAFAQPADFTDAAMFQDWAKPYIAYAQENGWMTGYPDGSFQADKEVPANQLAAVLLNALGYTFEYSNVLATAAELGIVVDGTALTRGEAFEAMWTAVSEVPMNTEAGLTLGVFLGKLEPVVVAPTALAVKSVMADNARQVKVEFNMPVDEDTIVAANLKVYIGTSTTATTWTSSVDGAMVTLGLTSDIPQDTDVKVVIKDVVAAGDKEAVKLAEVTQTVRMKDVTSPVIYSVVASTSKTFTFAVSEPIAVAAGEQVFHVLQNITVDGVKLVGKITPDYDANTLTVELGTKLAVGSHAIAATGLKDVVGFVANTFNGTIVVVEDKTAPSVVGVTYVDTTTLKVEFNEPVQTLGTITVDGIAVTASTANSTKTVYTITLASRLQLASVVRSILTYNGSIDMEGNAVATAKTFEFTAIDDVVAPTATVSVTSANKVKVVFSETMSVAGTLTVKDSKGVAVNVGALVLDTNDTTNKTYVSTNAIGAVAGTYTVELKDSQDNGVRQMTITATTTTVTTFDTTAPTISQVLLKSAYVASPLANGKATIFFSEAMDVATITNLANYLVDLDGAGAGAAVQLSTVTGAAAAAATDGKSVVLTIPGATFTAGTTTVSVLAVKDAAGNLINTTDFNVAKVVATTAPVLTESGFKLVATNKVKVVYTNALVSVDPSNFKIYTNDGTSPSLVGVAYELSADSKTVTITLNGDLTTSAYVSGDTVGLAKLEIETGNTKDIFGTASVEAKTVLVDEVAPTIKVATGTTTGSFTVTFSEAVSAVDFATLNNDMIVRDENGAIVTLSGANTTFTGGGAAITNFTVLTFTNAAATTKAYTVQVIERNIVDLATVANQVPALAATSVTLK